MPMNEKPSATAALPVVPLPQKGSRISPPFGVTRRQSHCIRSSGLTVGWGLRRAEGGGASAPLAVTADLRGHWLMLPSSRKVSVVARAVAVLVHAIVLELQPVPLRETLATIVLARRTATELHVNGEEKVGCGSFGSCCGRFSVQP